MDGSGNVFNSDCDICGCVCLHAIICFFSTFDGRMIKLCNDCCSDDIEFEQN